MFISLGTAIFGIVLIYLLYQRFIADSRRKRKQSASTSDDDERQSSSSDEKSISVATDIKAKQTTRKPSKIENKKKFNPTFVHPWLSATLKGHIGDVLGKA
uniref:Uncharacterized protein n=1 Tax=Romanomermis culicivorax TaxID=13658 RepID=A0A915K3L2_ROMCU